MKELMKIGGVCLILVLLAALGFKQPSAIAFSAVFYFLLIIIPGLAWTVPLRQRMAATFVLSNLIGFASGMVLVFGDVVFGLPMTAWTFAGNAVLVTAGGILFWKFSKHHASSDGQTSQPARE